MVSFKALAMTANVMAEQQDQYLEAGMNGVVSKPIDPRRLALAIRALMIEASPLAAWTAPEKPAVPALTP